MKKSTSAFTIVELIIVVIIIAILASVSVIAYRGVQGRARDADRKNDVANIAKALEQYYADNGRYPTASGTNSTAGASWYSSDTTSWATFSNVLVGAGLIDALPTDPLNITGNIRPLNSTGLNYAYYGNTGTYCGAGSGQMFIIEYRLEATPKEKFIDGSCNVNGTLWQSEYNNGSSYYMVVKGGG